MLKSTTRSPRCAISTQQGSNKVHITSTICTHLYEKLKIDPAIIYLYSISCWQRAFLSWRCIHGFPPRGGRDEGRDPSVMITRMKMGRTFGPTTKNIAEEPLQSVERFKRWKKRTEACIFAHQAELASAKSTDESGQRVSSYGEKRYGLRGTMSIELEKLRQEYKSKRENVEACQNWANESADTGSDRTRYHQISLQQAKGEAVIYQKAYGAALADAKRLCPGRTFQPATGNVSLGRVDTVVSIRDQ
ncbi:hypothetical protein AFUB_084780 [Aspergillus fumigatus A1163]|uniref:Uncharacterized protein n=1 Tax=Aspergillus fumigatus (strain CBS 144.89 / FGSC A1163 / CEA10) TaxID=451804 RepID=B0YAI4_ASPFC|nr:hypothetical protein AFUB_084780 [Aspergillus fumigatus A1163]